MIRILLILFAAAVITSAGAGDLLAQDSDTWPAMEKVNQKGWRGPGYYLSMVKIMMAWVVFACWVRTTDWVSQDAQELKFPYVRWNPIVFGPFMFAFVLLWLIPYFWLGFCLLVAAYVAPLATYIVQRNNKVSLHQKVLTRSHLRHWFSDRVGKVGVKVAAEKVDPHETGPPVKLLGHGGPDATTDNARMLLARQSEGFLPAREIIADALSQRASALVLEYTPQAVGQRYMVDGVWHKGESLEREKADPALEALKLLCGANPADRQSRQEGTFAAEFQSRKQSATFAAQGVKTGERVAIGFEGEKIVLETLDELGMRAKIQEQLKEMLDIEQGFLLFSALPAAGLKTTTHVVLHGTDRLMREFMAVEEENNRYAEIENIPVTTYSAAGDQTPVDIFPKFFRLDPNVVVVRDLVDAKTVGYLCDEIKENRLVIGTVRAKESVEALLRVLAMKVPPGDFAPAVSGVLCQRLIRRLCDKCKEAYMPPPQVLKQLGIPEGRVQAFYRPPQEREEDCPQCNNIGYYGRTALFELLPVGDQIRQVLTESPKLDLLRQAGRQSGMRTFQEEGILMVARGITSLPELMRVLKQ